MKRSEIQEIKELLSIPKNVVLVPHKNPDGDAMGASLAMYHFLMLKGHLVTVVSPNDYPDFLKWLPNSKEVLKFDMQNRQSKKAIEEALIIFLLDFNSFAKGKIPPFSNINLVTGSYFSVNSCRSILSPFCNLFNIS